MNTFDKILKYGCMSLILLFSSCIDEDRDNCPPDMVDGSYIRFVYDYNMTFEDLFSKQVNKLDVYCFDEYGSFLYQIQDQAVSGTFPKGYIMKIPEEAKEASRFVVWSGVGSKACVATQMTRGASSIDELEMHLKQYSNNEVGEKIEPVWYGAEAYKGGDTTTISLVKNTNTIRVVLQAVDDSVKLDINDFTFTMDAANGAYDSEDNVSSDTRWHYRPYLKYNEDESCGVAELNTLRLLADTENKLTVKHTPSQSTLLDIDLNKMINAMKAQDYSGMPLQEYMDREDDYKITIFVSSTTGGSWEVVKIEVNPWIPRDQAQSGN